MTDTTSMKHQTPLTSGDFTAADEPFALFEAWLNEAIKSEPNDPNAMALATVDPDGLPDVRMVLMKGFDADGFVFYSHIASQKGRELAANPKAALLFHWKSLRRQVRIRGNVTPVTSEEADAYFATRPKQAQIGAWASKQSQPLESRFAFEQAIAKVAAKYVIGLREARECHYWLRLIVDDRPQLSEAARDLLDECDQLVAILTAAVKTLRAT